MLLLASKLILQIILLYMFLYMYGLPAVEKLQRKSTIVIKTRNHTNGIEAPSITISARNNQTGIGWKRRPAERENNKDLVLHQCQRFDSVEECLKSETYSWPEFINDTLIGFDAKVSLMNETDIWIPDFTVARFGRSYTFQPKMRIGPDSYKDQLIVLLDKHFSYHIFVHEENFFIINDNCCAFPSFYEKLIPDASNEYKTYFTISATQHIERNVPEDPCVEDEDYKFHVCVKRNLARKVGCQPSWDVCWTENQTIPNCTEISEHRWATSTTRV